MPKFEIEIQLIQINDDGSRSILDTSHSEEVNDESIINEAFGLTTDDLHVNMVWATESWPGYKKEENDTCLISQ